MKIWQKKLPAGQSKYKNRGVIMENEIVKQPRWRSWAVWVSVLGAVWTIANAFGLTKKWGIEETTFKTVVDAIGVILIGFGILNNPTDKENF